MRCETTAFEAGRPRMGPRAAGLWVTGLWVTGLWVTGLWVTGLGVGVSSAQDLGGWQEPPGGWDYVYEAREGEDVDGEIDFDFAGGLSLDGTWTHDNGSDSWDGSGPGDEVRPDGFSPAAPGGAGIGVVEGGAEDGSDAEVLSIVDTGDPRSEGAADPSNRKVWFCHDVIEDGRSCSNCLASGLTLIVRSRLHPDVDPDAPGWQLPDGGLDNDSGQGAAPGYALRDGGKGGYGFYDGSLDRIFSMVPHGTTGYQLPPQVGEGLEPESFLEVGDGSRFHSMWVTIKDLDGDDRFDVTVYVDGSIEPHAEFPGISLGDASDCEGISHLHMGFHSTPQVGGLQVDYLGYKIGAHEPSSICPGGFSAALDPGSGHVDLEWTTGAVDGYEIRRNGELLAGGLTPSTTTFTDEAPLRPESTYELVAFEGGAPLESCRTAPIAVSTVLCPVLTCETDPSAGEVILRWSGAGFFEPAGYEVIRDGTLVATLSRDASRHEDSAPPGEHVYELEVLSDVEDACAVNAFCEARLFAAGAVEVLGDAWDGVDLGGATEIITTDDGVRSLHFPEVEKTGADVAAFAVMVDDPGEGDAANGRYRVEIRGRYSNELRIVNRSTVPESFIHLDLSRTGVSTATDEQGDQETIEQVPDPAGGPTVDSAASTVVNTDTLGLTLVEGLNLIEVLPVDATGLPHPDAVQVFELRIGPFAADLIASMVSSPCPTGLVARWRERCGEALAVELEWRSSEPHAYEVERDGERIAEIPAGGETLYLDAEVGPGEHVYSLRVTDASECPERTTSLMAAGQLDTDGYVRDWLILGPLDWGCPGSCANPGESLIREDHLAGVSGGVEVDQESIEPIEGMPVTLGGSTVRATGRADLNPDRPETATWFAYSSPGSLVDANVAFGGDPGDNYMLYAAAYVRNTTGDDLLINLEVTSDDSVEVYLDDESVWVNNVARGVGPLDLIPDILLPDGLHRILIKVFEGGGGTGFGLRITDAFALPPEGIEVSLCPETLPDPRPTFVRGDADASGGTNITDGIFILNNLFLGGPNPPCRDAADADDSGGVNITDGIFILNNLFLGGPNPPEPRGECGSDPTDDDPLDCEAFAPCR